MSNRDKKIMVVKDMVACGYCLFNETPEQFIDRVNVSLETLKSWCECFKKAKGVN